MADAVQVPAGGVTSGTQSTNLHQHVCTSADGGADIDYFKLTSPTAAGLVFAEVEKSAVFDYEDASCTNVSYYLLNIRRRVLHQGQLLPIKYTKTRPAPRLVITY